LADKYRLIREVGRGGMGAVYLAENVATRRLVAVKVLRSGDCNDTAVVRLYREAQAATAVGHPAIVDVLDLYESEFGPFIVMEWLDGQSLAELFNMRGSFSPRETIDVAVQVLSALVACHAKGIIHRDLKPGNLFFCHQSDGAIQVKLLDFGASKFLARNTDLGLTATGAVLGTPYYMSPEQARGARDLDERVDIWGLGVVLYEMLTARRPYEGENYNELMARIISDPVPPPGEANPTLPHEIDDVLLKALAKDRRERYRTAAEFRDALKQLRPLVQAWTGTSLPRPVEWGEVDTMPWKTELSFADSEIPGLSRRPTGRRRLLAWSLGAVAVVAGALTGVLLWSPAERSAAGTVGAGQAAEPETPSPGRNVAHESSSSLSSAVVPTLASQQDAGTGDGGTEEAGQSPAEGVAVTADGGRSLARPQGRPEGRRPSSPRRRVSSGAARDRRMQSAGPARTVGEATRAEPSVVHDQPTYRGGAMPLITSFPEDP
jgi:serine/threonine protein kinase